MQNELLYSDKEICNSYLSAKNKAVQVNILAQLNGTTTYRIIHILKKNGIYDAEVRKRDPEQESIIRYSTLSEDKLTELYISHMKKLKCICKALEIKVAGGN